MAKKYLLYIHDERFGKEPQKSGLINLLLSRHYDYFEPGTLIEELPDEDQELHKDTVVGNPDLREKLDEGRVCPRHHVPFSLCANNH